MSRPRYHDKPDTNKPQIIAAVEGVGGVWHNGPPLDGWAGYKGKWTLVEVKTETGVLSDGQEDTLAECQRLGLPCGVVRSEMDVLLLIGAVK